MLATLHLTNTGCKCCWEGEITWREKYCSELQGERGHANDAIDLATICRFQFPSGCVSKHFTGQVTYNEWLAGLEHLFEFNNVLFLKGLPPVS